MCDLLGSLQGKLEIFRCRTPPGVDGLGGGHAVKGVIDFHAVKLAGIILKELLVGEAFRIELWPPFLVAEARRPKPDWRHPGIITHARQKKRDEYWLEHHGAAEFCEKWGLFGHFLERFFNSGAGVRNQCKLL